MSAAASSKITTVITPNLAGGSGVEPGSKIPLRRVRRVLSGLPKCPGATLGRQRSRTRGRSRPRAALGLGAAPATTFGQFPTALACSKITRIGWLWQALTQGVEECCSLKRGGSYHEPHEPHEQELPFHLLLVFWHRPGRMVGCRAIFRDRTCSPTGSVSVNSALWQSECLS